MKIHTARRYNALIDKIRILKKLTTEEVDKLYKKSLEELYEIYKSLAE